MLGNRSLRVEGSSELLLQDARRVFSALSDALYPLHVANGYRISVGEGNLDVAEGVGLDMSSSSSSTSSTSSSKQHAASSKQHAASSKQQAAGSRQQATSSSKIKTMLSIA